MIYVLQTIKRRHSEKKYHFWYFFSEKSPSEILEKKITYFLKITEIFIALCNGNTNRSITSIFQHYKYTMWFYDTISPLLH